MMFTTGTGDKIGHSELPALEQLVQMGFVNPPKKKFNAKAAHR